MSVKLFRTDNEITDLSGKKIVVGDFNSNEWISYDNFINGLPSDAPLVASISNQTDFDEAYNNGVRSFWFETTSLIDIPINADIQILGSTKRRRANLNILGNATLADSTINEIEFTNGSGNPTTPLTIKGSSIGYVDSFSGGFDSLSIDGCRIGYFGGTFTSVSISRSVICNMGIGGTPSLDLSQSKIGMYFCTQNITDDINQSTIDLIRGGTFKGLDFSGKTVVWDSDNNPFELNKTAL